VNAPPVPASIGLGIGLGAVALVAIGGIAFVLWKNKERFDVTSSKNLAYTGANNVGAALTGDEHFSLGVKVFDVVDSIKGFFGGGEPDLTEPTVAPDPLHIETSPFSFGA
jgi:hypothetical protein